MEKRFPFTMSLDEFHQLRVSSLSEFKAQLESSRSGGYSGKAETVNKALAALAEAGYTGLTAKDLSRLKESPMEDEILTVMAATDAYFRVSVKRFGDTIPMSIDYHFLSQCSDLLEKELVTQLGILDKDPEQLSLLLQENRDVVEKRSQLIAQKSRLEVVWKLLQQV
jgi:hypothetical protein